MTPAPMRGTTWHSRGATSSSDAKLSQVWFKQGTCDQAPISGTKSHINIVWYINFQFSVKLKSVKSNSPDTQPVPVPNSLGYRGTPVPWYSGTTVLRFNGTAIPQNIPHYTSIPLYSMVWFDVRCATALRRCGLSCTNLNFILGRASERE